MSGSVNTISPKLLQKFTRRIFSDPARQTEFMQTLKSPPPLAPSIVWLQPDLQQAHQSEGFLTLPPVSWQPAWVDRLQAPAQPGKHSLHAAGAFYCLDFSSVFATVPLLQLTTQPQVVLDLCAAPGGKSVLAWRAVKPQRLICNEVIGKRLGMLISNLRRCHINPVYVCQQDPSRLAAHLPRSLPLILVDAPCSGQSLLIKGTAVPGCFHPVTLNRNANRQKRILAHATQMLAPGGYLLYTTCTYAREENEQVAEWLCRQFPQLQAIPVPALKDYQSHLADFPCYRLWPQSGLGAGAFTVLLQNLSTTEAELKPLDLTYLEQIAVF
ncbi:MAG: RsmB/NOP family class I SAM-dependent RNA methyltransferase [Cyanobacteria bacterium P01_H01_bin.121]